MTDSPAPSQARRRNVPENETIVQCARRLILLSSAVFAAELFLAGDAQRVEFEEESGRPVYTIDVARRGRVATVRVEPLAGEISLVAAEGSSRAGSPGPDRS